jgi:hypothetical protein
MKLFRVFSREEAIIENALPAIAETVNRRKTIITAENT